jgi:membrane protease YdiL (CAAX protease family)
MFIFASFAKGNDETVIAEGKPIDFLLILLSVFSIGVGYWFIKTRRSSLPRRGYLDPAITPTMAILLAAAMFILMGLGELWGASQASDSPDGTLGQSAWIYASVMIAQIPVVIVYAMLRKRCGSRRVVEIALTAFIVFVPMAFAVAGVLHWIFSMVGIEPPIKLGHEILIKLSDGSWTMSAWIIVICVTIGAGIFEEVLYRGLILPTFTAVLSGRTAWGAIVATSVFFAAMHIGSSSPSAIGGLFILSIGLCWARVKSGGVLAPIVIHIVFNATNIAIVYSTTL